MKTATGFKLCFPKHQGNPGPASSLQPTNCQGNASTPVWNGTQSGMAKVNPTRSSLFKVKCINGGTGQLVLIWKTTTYDSTGDLQSNAKCLEQPKCLENLATKGVNLRMWDVQAAMGSATAIFLGMATASLATMLFPWQAQTFPVLFQDWWWNHCALLGWQPPARLALPCSCQRFNWGGVQSEKCQLSSVPEGQPQKQWMLLTKHGHLACEQHKETAEPLTERTECCPQSSSSTGHHQQHLQSRRLPGLVTSTAQSGHSCFQPGQQEPRASAKAEQSPCVGRGLCLHSLHRVVGGHRLRAAQAESPEKGLLPSQSWILNPRPEKEL